MILALETVFEQCSVALLKLDGQLIDQHTLTGNRMQTQQILPMIKSLLDAHQLDFQDLTAIAFNRGPGAFSGIRISTAVAQAVAFAHDLPCLAVSSLQAVAQMALIEQQFTHVYAAIDARMNQVYFGEFVVTDGTMQLVQNTQEMLLDYEMATTENLPIVGNGATLLTPLPNQSQLENIIPQAAIIGQLGAMMWQQGQTVTAENALPVYLRHNAWKTLAEQGK